MIHIRSYFKVYPSEVRTYGYLGFSVPVFSGFLYHSSTLPPKNWSWEILCIYNLNYSGTNLKAGVSPNSQILLSPKYCKPRAIPDSKSWGNISDWHFLLFSCDYSRPWVIPLKDGHVRPLPVALALSVLIFIQLECYTVAKTMSLHFISTAWPGQRWKGRKFTQGTVQFATRYLTTSSIMNKNHNIEVDKYNWQNVIHLIRFM